MPADIHEFFSQSELNLLRMACLSAAYMSRKDGHTQQADDFSDLADKVADLEKHVLS